MTSAFEKTPPGSLPDEVKKDWHMMPAEDRMAILQYHLHNRQGDLLVKAHRSIMGYQFVGFSTIIGLVILMATEIIKLIP